MILRKIDKYLKLWKDYPTRQVLLLRGARQVGKTFSVRQLANGFSSFLEVNFLETPDVCQFFQSGSLSPAPILEKLQAYYGVSLIPGESLLFFDEIQACPEALTALRFFQEKFGSLHIIAAGSLLEFALAEIPSFGVGRIESLFMYPLSVAEFMAATGQQPLLDQICKASPNSPLDSTLHVRSIEILKTYSLLGGLPAVIQTYLDSRDLNKCINIIENLVIGYEDDFAKYRTRLDPLKLRETLRSCARQAGGKFVYSRVKAGSSSSGYDQALELLRLAGLIYKVQRSAANGLPLGAEINQKSFKVIPFDIGLYHRLLNLKISDLLTGSEVTFVNSGALSEVLCGVDTIANADPHKRAELYYWARESKGANAEVDYLAQIAGAIVPIEVKAGTKGQMQSMYRFLMEKKSHRGLRTSLENFSQFNTPDGQAVIDIVPLYAIGSYLAAEQ